MSGAISLVETAPRVGRRLRNPKHTFQLRTVPYGIQPFMIAPVLPGETLKSLLLQSRVVSDPVKNPLIGWWKEYYFFYVKLRDLNSADKYTTMLMTPGYDVSANALLGAADAGLYRYNNSMNFIAEIYTRVVLDFFRDEGETPAPWRGANGLYLASAYGNNANWLENLTMDSVLPDQDPNDVSFEAEEKQRLTWEWLRAQKMTALSYEQWLRTFGITSVDEKQKPELVRYVREWTYPANTVDGSGAVNSALSWSIQERADKDRFFKEHGFLVGFTVARPKVYMKNQTGSAAGLLNSAFDWLPAALRENPEITLKQVPELTGPLPVIDDTAVGSYWVDIKDLYLYGDQFINFALTATDAGLVALPTAAGARKYVSDADVDAMFKVGTNNLIREDGVVALSILGTAEETT